MYKDLCRRLCGHIVSKDITGSYDIFIFRFWANFHTDFHCDYTSLHSHQEWISNLFLHNLTSICCHLLSLWYMLTGGEIGSAFPLLLWILNTFKHAYYPLVFLLLKLSVQLHCSFFNRVVHFFIGFIRSSRISLICFDHVHLLSQLLPDLSPWPIPSILCLLKNITLDWNLCCPYILDVWPSTVSLLTY